MARARRSFGTAVLSLLVVAACDCGGETLTTIPPPESRTDTACQIRASSIDVLFVIDDSRSMVEEQAALAANFEAFLRYLDPDPSRTGETGEVDYRIAVTTTDAEGNGGALVGTPAVISPGPEALAQLQQNVQVGIGGGALEQGLAAAEAALHKAASRGDFMRAGAYLYVIIVTDEEDGSFGEVRYYYRAFETIKGIGNEQTVAVSAIAGPAPGGCENATAGTRYQAITEATGGLLGSICTEDWSATLRDLAVTGLGLRKRFQLPVAPKDVSQPEGIGADDVRVLVRYPCDAPDRERYLDACENVVEGCSDENDSGSSECFPFFEPPHGWVYDPSENALVFDGLAVPGPGACVEATYYERDE